MKETRWNKKWKTAEEREIRRKKILEYNARWLKTEKGHAATNRYRKKYNQKLRDLGVTALKYVKP